MITFTNPAAEIFIPDAETRENTFQRTTQLAIGAHADDLEIFAYAAIATCYRNPHEFFGGVTVTDGAGSARTGKYANHDAAEMIACRAREQRNAASLGEYAFQVQLFHPSKECQNPENPAVVSDLKQLLLATRPNKLFLHNPFDRHPTHLAVLHHSLRALHAIEPSLRPPVVLGCEVWRDLDWLPEKHRVHLNCDPHPNLAAALLGAFDSQIAGGKRYDLATLGRRTAHATFNQSHQVDSARALTLAVDLGPIARQEITLTQWVENILQDYRLTILTALPGYPSQTHAT